MERRRLPEERFSITRGFKLPYTHKDGTTDTMKFYFTAGMYEDGTLGEVFAKADKQGTLVGGLMDNTCINMSIGLQSGVPLDTYLQKMRHSRFPPAGITRDEKFPSCTSALDLLAQWLTHHFMFICQNPQCGDRRAIAYKAERVCIAMACKPKLTTTVGTLAPVSLAIAEENATISHAYVQSTYDPAFCHWCNKPKENAIHLAKDGSPIQ